MEEDGNLIVFQTEDGEEAAFYVLEETKVSGKKYLLVAETDEEESEALILRESKDRDADGEAVYDVVEDEEEMRAVSRIFEQLMEDYDIQMSEEN